MIERCGDRQRKCDGLERWPFRLCMESLPIMLQIALLLLMCGLSQSMWSVNTSVARVVISFTVLGVVFYIGIVAAGTSSYECPFQTPASTGLRRLRHSETTQRLLASLSLPKVISFIHTTWKKTRQALHRVYDTTRSPPSWEISLSRIGHQTIILLLRIDRAFGNAKQRLVQGIRRFSRTLLLPIATEGAHRRSVVPRKGPGLLVRVWNLEDIRRQNTDNACCVSWVLRSITDPEAIDSAVRLAGAIRWFDGDPDHDPPFDLIVSAFETCFDSNKQLYPGMRDRAYFSARAILQINMSARAQSHEHASKYPIPAVSPSSVQHTDPDLHHIISMLECNFTPGKPTLTFPRVDLTTHAHSLWMSNLFVYLTHVGPNPTMKSYNSYLSAAFTNNQATISNTLLMWYMFLGGHVEEETIWAVDKSYVVSLFPSFTLLKIVNTSDSLETILFCLSTRVMNTFADENYLPHLRYLLEFLAGWEKRPECLTSMAYQWCSTISEAAGTLNWSELIDLRFLQPLRLRSLDPDTVPNRLFRSSEGGFSEVGSGCDPLRLDDTSHRACGHLQGLTPNHYIDLLRTTLEIGFRLVTPNFDQPAIRLNHTSNHNQVFEATFSSDDDEAIADAVSVWIVDDGQVPPGLCMQYLVKRMERDIPFSQRLRRVTIHAIEHIWSSELEASGLQTVRLLNYLNVDESDMVKEWVWVRLVVGVICLPAGLEGLSSHYWHLLDKLASVRDFRWIPGSCNVEVMESLKRAEDWEKLEIWMIAVWQSLSFPVPVSVMEDIEQAILMLLMRRTSAPQRFEALCEHGSLWPEHKAELQQICDRAQAERLLSEPLPLPYVFVCPARYPSVLMPSVSLPQSTDSRPVVRSTSFCRRRHFLKVFTVFIVG
jgi:hypothetical protein